MSSHSEGGEMGTHHSKGQALIELVLSFLLLLTLWGAVNKVIKTYSFSKSLENNKSEFKIKRTRGE